MKKRIWMPLIVLAAVLLIFGAYRVYDRHITDTVAPRIHIDETEALQVSVTDPYEALLQGVTAVDARDGDVTASVIVESVGSINGSDSVMVTYAAFDRAGNVTKAQRTVQYTDYRSPWFTLSAPLAFPYGSRTDVLDCIGAKDVLEGDISYRVKTTMMDNATITAEGTHNVLFRVTNSLGDTTELIFPVEVYAAGKYDATLTLTDYVIYLPEGSAFNAQDYLGRLTASGRSVALTGEIPEEVSVQTRGAVNINEPGVYTVAYTAIIRQNDRDYTGYSKLIVVVEG